MSTSRPGAAREDLIGVAAPRANGHSDMVADDVGATTGPGDPQDEGCLSPDRSHWWTGEEWAPPVFERGGLSALVTYLSRFMGTLRVFPGAVAFVAARACRGWRTEP